MTHAHHPLVKADLETQLIAVTAELKEIASYTPETDDWEAIPETNTVGNADENVEADVVEDWNQRRATVATLEHRYQDIKRALEKIALGSYGICEISGEVIEPERLQALPTARTCMAHMHEEESLRY